VSAGANLGDMGHIGGGMNMTNIATGKDAQLMKELIAYYNNNVGDANINANLIKPMGGNSTMMNLMGSMPVGEGRVSMGLHGSNREGHNQLNARSLGYQAPMGGGNFNANITSPVHGSPSANVNWTKQFADGGEAKPYFGGAATKKYAAAKQRAEDADVNLLKDPKTYAAVAGLMGEAPDEMGFSVLHPDYQGIKSVAEPAFGIGTALGVAPLVGPALKAAKATGKFAGKGALEMVNKGMMGEGPLRNFVPQNQFVIKPTGGNWLNNSVENSLKGLKSENRQISPALFEGFEQSAKDPTDPLRERSIRRLREHNDEIALNNYVDRNLTNYVKKQMATPDDPVRRLAEEGITHMPANEIDYVNQWIPEHLAVNRMKAGFPSEGMGKSNTARGWETLTDNFIHSAPAREYTKPLTESEARRGFKSVVEDNPWLTKLDPETQVTYLDSPDALRQELGFDHIMDVLREDVAAGRIRPEQLNKVSMEQAVRRVHEYDQELAAKMNASRAAAREGLPVHKEYPEGYKWIELNKPGSFALESEAMGHSVRGYEPPKGHPDWVEGSGEMGSLGYGHGGWEAIKSGKAKVYSLVNPKGAPHTTVEIKAGKPWNERNGIFYDNPELEPSWQKFSQEASLEEKAKGLTRPSNYIERYPEWLKANEPEVFAKHAHVFENDAPRITQIKGKQNRAPKEEYLPYVQDFVKSGKWSDVGDISNTGLTNVRDYLNPSTFKEYEKYKLNVPKYATDEELDRLHNEYLRMAEPHNYKPDIPPPEGMKRGGAACGCDKDLNAAYKRFKKGGSCGCPKLAKGGITGDDLIIEERPL
jgi:hypothetical protein